ncbi:MAG: galactose-1-phosphate uridylyltransferase, partial [Oscillospiraceae bacterium]|nr:galactose-1-phosphate uridylyltransferase [Oscillospiraceae bacterium]
DLADAAVSGKDVSSDETLSKHAEWLSKLRKEYTFTEENAAEIILKETGKVFAEVLEDAGVYKNTAEGKEAFLRFIDKLNKEEI